MTNLDMESMAASIGVSVPVLRFLLCFVATIPVSFFWRVFPTPLARHAYAALSGAILSYLSFGFSSNLHFLVPMLSGYLSMLFFRAKCGILTFFLGFAYLIGCHVYYMSGDAWKEGGIDATGALMVLTLKVISCAINYNDGLLKEEGLREAQKKNRLIKLPSLIEYFGYCLCCGSHFAGPVYEMKDYLEWTEGKGIWSGPWPSPYLATLRALVQAAFCMALYLYMAPHHPLSRFTEPLYQEWGFWKRLSYTYMVGLTARWKYYFIWSISEAAIIISGLGISGWTDSSPPKPKWERAKAVDILGVEFAKSAVQIPLVWNIQVSTWLRHYVYERLVKKNKKPGFFELLATQTVSAVWHGLYPGYIIFFVQSALMIAGSRVIYRWQQGLPPNMGIVKMILDLMNFAYTVLVLNYSSVGFIVLSLHETIASYRSLYYIGELKKILAECTGLHPQDQKLIYKKKERDSKVYLDAARVKNGSKIVLVVDIASRERRCLEMLKQANIERASKSFAEISLEVDKLVEQVTDLQAVASKGEKVLDIDLENLIGKLMTELVKLDEISVGGDLNLQKREQEGRVQKHIEILDMLKLSNSKLKSNGGNIQLHKQEHSNGKKPILFEQQQRQSKQRNLAGQRLNLQHPLRHSLSVVGTTKWETFD